MPYLVSYFTVAPAFLFSLLSYSYSASRGAVPVPLHDQLFLLISLVRYPIVLACTGTLVVFVNKVRCPHSSSSTVFDPVPARYHNR